MPKKTYAPVKPARSYEEQARRLMEAHGLEIGDIDHARDILSTVNYYRLTTYGKHLRRMDDPERFIPGVSLDTLYALYCFDMGLRHALLPVLEFFEVQLRARLSYRLAMAHGSAGYTDASRFRQDKQSLGLHKSLMNKFRIEVRRQDDLPFVRHHQSKYGGQFPIWVAVELFSFGMLAQLFDIMTEDDQWAVSREYRMAPDALAALIHAAVGVRNVCAHYGRLYNQTLGDQPLLPPEYAQYAGDGLFPTLLALYLATGGNPVYDEMRWRIAALLTQYPQAEPARCGFPPEWERLMGGM